jgi:hypothetical protein
MIRKACSFSQLCSRGRLVRGALAKSLAQGVRRELGLAVRISVCRDAIKIDSTIRSLRERGGRGVRPYTGIVDMKPIS